MDRREELENYLKENLKENSEVFLRIVDGIVFLEEQLDILRGYPFLKVNPNNPTMQKTTAAAKQYKELSQTYLNTIKVIISCTNNNGGGEDSPLRAYIRKLNKSYE